MACLWQNQQLFIEEDPTYICYVYIIYWKFLSSNRNLLFVYYAFINMSTKKTKI